MLLFACKPPSRLIFRQGGNAQTSPAKAPMKLRKGDSGGRKPSSNGEVAILVGPQSFEHGNTSLFCVVRGATCLQLAPQLRFEARLAVAKRRQEWLVERLLLEGDAWCKCGSCPGATPRICVSHGVACPNQMGSLAKSVQANLRVFFFFFFFLFFSES